MTFREFIWESDGEIQNAKKKMKEAGFELKNEKTLISEITKKYGLTPIKIYDIIKEETTKAK